MDLFEAFILGLVQGLTEFLPISSTAHLRVVPALAGWADPGAAFTAVIQIGTLVAVLWYFRTDIVRIGTAWARGLAGQHQPDRLDERMGWMMIVATIPIVVVGLAFQHTIETSLRSLWVVAGTSIALALLLGAAELFTAWQSRRGQMPKTLSDVNWTDAVAIGGAQALALIPGASRSGVTITVGLFRSLSRETAARFSFLLSLPSVLAAGLYQLYKARHELLATSNDAAALIVATLVAGVVGYLSIAFLLKFLRTHTTLVFIVYRLLFGGLILYALSSGLLAATS